MMIVSISKVAIRIRLRCWAAMSPSGIMTTMRWQPASNGSSTAAAITPRVRLASICSLLSIATLISTVPAAATLDNLSNPLNAADATSVSSPKRL
jgi:hypothetical protein